MALTSSRSGVPAPFLGFAVFGAFWGTWGAAIPAVRAQAGVDDGQLGAALLFVGVGALPAMLLAGRVVDRFGQRAAAVFLAALGVAALVLAVVARDQVTLSLALAAVGVTSGAADVAINAAASSAQASSSRPVVSRSHGLFSVAVVLSSLGTGGLLALGAPLVVPFAIVTAAAVTAALALRATARESMPPAPAPARGGGPGRWGAVGLGSLVVVGALSALAFAAENAHQSWSAIFLGDVLGASPALAATGPALFAAVVATVRFTTSALGVAHPIAVVTAGALTAAAGTLVLAGATTLTVGLLGLAVAAAGTAVLYPTLISALSTHLPDSSRGSAISIVATIAYAGFLAGPVYVGGWAAAGGLPTAMLAVAALAALLAAASPFALRAALAERRDRRPKPCG
jgi:MFS family permease